MSSKLPTLGFVDGALSMALLAIGRPHWLGAFAAAVYLISMMTLSAIIRRRLP